MNSLTKRKYGVEYIIPTNTFKRTGYSFTGWNTKKDGKGITYKDGVKVSNLTIADGRNIILYAQWKKETYKITYELNGGTNGANPTIYNVTTATITLKNPVRTGYTFSGWYLDANFKTKVTEIKKGSAGNKKIYAKWTPYTYSISFDANGATSGKMNSLTKRKYGIGYILPTNTFKRTGYIFTGWNTKKDGKGMTYKDGEKVSNLTIANGREIVLYAQWKKETYRITYELDYGVNGANPNTYNITTSTITLKNASRNGAIFAGWYLDANFKTKVTEIKKGSTGNKKLYAKWKLINYTITYELNGGKNALNPAGYTAYSVVTFSNPTKTGYRFLGWYLDSSFTNKIEKIEKNSYGNKKLYAKWELIEYDIIYELNGGFNNLGNPRKYNITSEVRLLTPVKDGYRFLGWYLDSSFNTPIEVIEQGNIGTKTVYAKWTPITYSIRYDVVDGSIGANRTSYTIEDTPIQLKTPSRTGYTFMGWYLDSSYTNKISVIEEGTIGNLDIYAKWSAINYSITYETYGGVNNSNPRYYTIESSTIRLNSARKDGYIFMGWYEDPSFNNRVTTIPSRSTGSRTLYAKWQLEEYNIEYETDGGDNRFNPYHYNIESNTIYLEPAEKTGYEFLGWYTDSSYINRITRIDQGSFGNKILYAKWGLIEYNINYVLNGGKNSSNPYSYNILTNTIILNEPAKTNYTFAGWYTDSSFTGSPVRVIDKGSTGDITLYAKWVTKEYRITYYLDGGTNNEDNPSSYNNTMSTITLKNPTRKGYSFEGWYLDSNYDEPITRIYTNAKTDYKIFAKWEIITYNIYYENVDGYGYFNSGNIPRTYTIEDSFKLPSLTGYDFKFLGWQENDSQNVLISLNKGTTGDLVLKAIWGKVV